MPQLPAGTVTFLFTDIEGSTRLAEHLGDAAWQRVFADYRRLVRDAVEVSGGHVYQDQGESFLFVFERAKDAVLTAIKAQRALARHPWPEGITLRVRMGLHSGEPVVAGDGYAGLDIHRAARICSAGHGGQILLSETTRGLTADALPNGISLRDLGEYWLKDLSHAQRLFQVIVPDLPMDFPPLRSLDVPRNNLPRQLTSFIGREREIQEATRLLTTGCAGGKPRCSRGPAGKGPVWRGSPGLLAAG